VFLPALAARARVCTCVYVHACVHVCMSVCARLRALVNGKGMKRVSSRACSHDSLCAHVYACAQAFVCPFSCCCAAQRAAWPVTTLRAQSKCSCARGKQGTWLLQGVQKHPQVCTGARANRVALARWKLCLWGCQLPLASTRQGAPYVLELPSSVSLQHL